MKLVIGLVALCVVTCFAASETEHSLDLDAASIKQLQTMSVFFEQIEEVFREEYHTYLDTGVKSARLTKLLTAFQMPKELAIKEVEDLIEPRSPALCLMCRTLIAVFISRRQGGADENEMMDVAVDLCMQTDMLTYNVCRGVVNLNAGIFLHIVDHTPDLSANNVCGFVFQAIDCTNSDARQEWNINVAGGGNAITGPKSSIPAPSGSDLTVVHISDNHYDTRYIEGGNAECGEPCCCRSNQPLPQTADAAAGRWGDYRDCGTPWEGFEEVLNHVREANPSIDWLYFTGDILDHGVWETSGDGNVWAITRTYNAFKSMLPNVQVYPALGNHEAHPTNTFVPSFLEGQHGFGSAWLYNMLADLWSTWLPSSALTTVRLGGYYTVLARPGLRIISLNNNECYAFNFWLLLDPQYPSTQLQWFHDTLLAAEAAGEKVHLLAHIPSGSGSCMIVWAREFRRIIDRFWDTISGQFNGHTHRDEFNLYYARSQPSAAINVAWNAGSSTAFSHVNPNYRFYKVAPTDYQVVEANTWSYNLTLANVNRDSRPSWSSYNFGTKFGASNLSPSGLNGVVESLASNPSLLREYWELTSSRADTTLAGGCDDACLRSWLCRIVTTEHRDSSRCNQLRSVFDKTIA